MKNMENNIPDVLPELLIRQYLLGNSLPDYSEGKITELIYSKDVVEIILLR